MRRPTWRGNCRRSWPMAARQQAGVAWQVLERQRQAEVGHHADQAFVQALGHRVVDPVRRHATVQVVGGHGRPHEQEIVVEVVAVQQPARHRVEEGLGAFGLAMLAQQADEFLLDLLPVGGLRFSQRGARGAVRAVGAMGADRALGPPAQHAFELAGALAHAHVVVLDAFARQALDAVPVARFEQRLGALRAVAEQRVVAVEAGQDAMRDVQRRGPCAGACSMCWTSDVRIMADSGRIRPSRRTARGRSACGGSRWCRRRFHTAWRRATGGPPGIH